MRKFLIFITGMVATLTLAIVIAVGCFTNMPGKSHEGILPDLSEMERELAGNLKAHVTYLADTIGERNVFNKYEKLVESEVYIQKELNKYGYTVKKQGFDVDGHQVHNVEAILKAKGSGNEVIVIGAHYDSADGTPAANDNGSGVAALLELARMMRGDKPNRELRFVFFVNEEPPYFQSEDMGSLRYAKRCHKRGENVVAMLSLETIGYYTDEPGTQQYPAALASKYPDKGNFIAFVGNLQSRSLVLQCVKLFREQVEFPAEGGSLPGALPGIGWSDHWSFWRAGYEAVMVTDTAPFRYPHYHEPEDTPDKIDYERTARVTLGLLGVIRALDTDE